MQFLNMFRSESEIFMDAVEKEMRNYLLENGVGKGKIRIERRKKERSELFLFLKQDTYFYVGACIHKIDAKPVIGYQSCLMQDNPSKKLSINYERDDLKLGLKGCLPYYGISYFQLKVQSRLAETKLDRLLKIISDTKRQKTTPSTI